MMSNIYSKSFLQASPTLTALTKTILHDRLVPRMEKFASTGEDVNIYSELAAATMDFVTGYQFGAGQSSNFIQDVKFREEYLDWYMRRIGYNFWPQEHPQFTSFLAKFGIKLSPDFVSTANDEIEKWTLSMVDAATEYLRRSGASKVEDITSEDDKVNFPMVFSQMVTAMSKAKGYDDVQAEQRRYEVASEMLDHLAAGFDTSSITLCYIVHELSQHPDVQAKLREELRTLHPHITPAAKDLDALPYLEAVLQESLRLHAAIPGPQPRITPPEGCLIGPEGEGGCIPGGVRISAQAHSLHRNPEVFEKPNEWIPSRWLDASEESAKEMRRWFWAFGSGGRMCVGSNLAIYRKSSC